MVRKQKHSNELLDGLKSDMQGTQVPEESRIGSGKEFFWLVIDTQGHKTVAGPYPDANTANSVAYDRLQGSAFEVVGLNTRSKPAAISILKNKRWGATNDLGKALEKMGHKLPGEYKQKPWKSTDSGTEDN